MASYGRDEAGSSMNVVITGASSGIGRALVVAFSQHWHPVLAVARRGDRLQVLCEDLGEQGATVYAFPQDITCPGASQAVFQEAVRVFSKVHVLINNAGMSPYQRFEELPLVHLRQAIALNVQALTELCHVFLPHMLAHGEPSHVVNVGSVGGYAPLPNFAVYTGTKHYIRAFTNVLGHEYRGSNIQVSALHPGGSLTEFPPLAGQRIKPFALKTMLTPEQLAEKAYPAIMQGKRVIVIGLIDKAAILIGKLLPFPWSMRVTELIYKMNVEKIDPTYPL
jgi:short-subunit dehydrogenase